MQTENTPFVAYEPAPKLNFFIFLGGPAHSSQASSGWARP